MEKQTAGRSSLGEFAPKFAELNDDILFGEVWSREDKLSLRDRSLVTICVFMGKGMVDSSLKYHLINARKNGITKTEMAEIITHAAFYSGWPNAWAVFNMAKEVLVELKKEKNEIILEVKNMGDPIPKEEREKIFERFYRIDKSRNRKEKRYGLGLAICKSTVQKYNGNIEVYYKEPFTDFKVTIPL